MEIIDDELGLSPVHTAAFRVIRGSAGLAVRFHKFTGRWRPDKAPKGCHHSAGGGRNVHA
ncbi:hypothetical protein [Candidatus Pyrohabitans sp.]